MATQENHSILVSQAAAARLLGISVDTVRKVVAAGTLTPVVTHPGAHPRFRRADVEALAAGSTTAAAP